jgi:hypothetical protein
MDQTAVGRVLDPFRLYRTAEEIKAKGGDSIVQTANVTGDHNITTQIAGSGNVVQR